MQRVAGEGVQLEDARPQVAAQRRRDDVLNNSPQALQQKARGELIAQSAHTVQQRARVGVATQLQREAGPAKANNTGLPDTLKAGIESLSGMSMDHVKVHYNSPQPAQLNALAYAQGGDIHVGPGQEKHLPHEAWHVVQQGQGRVRPTMQAKGVAINDNAGLEHEADVMGAKALQMVVAPTAGVSVQLQASGVVQREEDGDDEESHGSASGDTGVTSWAEMGRDLSVPFSATDAAQLKAVVQLAHGAGDSGPKDYTTTFGQVLTGVKYVRDGNGYIDFTKAPAAITSPGGWKPTVDKDNTDIRDPKDTTKLNLLLANKTVPKLTASTRPQHFQVANAKAGTTGSSGKGSSPSNYTWHHKDTNGFMVLVDRTVHQKHGHNGGVYLWV